MELAAVLPGVRIAPAAQDLEVERVVSDSRQVGPGDLFVAVSGAKTDGLAHVPEALDRGAVAIVCDRPASAGAAVPWFRVPSARRALALLSARVHGDPTERLVLAGVTGTNGKTSTAVLLEAMLKRHYGKAGFLGTIGYRTARREIDAARTTPEAPLIQELLAELVEDGVPAAAMEVSSHALVLDRVEGCRFDVAVFTNLTRDHLDFHGDMESYYAAKKRLLELRKPGGFGVVNADDPYGQRLLAEAAPPVASFSPSGGPADDRAESVVCDLSGTSFDVVSAAGRFRIASPLLGRFQVGNLLGAAAAAARLGIPPAEVAPAAAGVENVPGRLERVEAGQTYPILVDYAHTPDALERLLEAVRELTDRKVILVFGCGGDRDRGKRAPMGEIAGRLADIAIATSDNPRSENPEAILRDVEAGLISSGATKYLKVVERREAIRQALELANPGTVVVIAGKGHESTQAIGSLEIPFDDRKVAAELVGRP
ncbi:MAG: UDP-N-acetylmuramoyl-L-alanyl-D-glutamate--2,6-diaminopimelate ligase [Thermoanaerobaculia bacterium]